MPYMWSTSANDEVWVDGDEPADAECEECGGDLADELWDEDDGHIFCIFCYDNIFG